MLRFPGFSLFFADRLLGAHMAHLLSAGRRCGDAIATGSPQQQKGGLGRPWQGRNLQRWTLLAFATSPGQSAPEGDGINSAFSTALVRHIGTPGLEVQQMLARVRAEVVASTRSKQVRWSNSSLLGEIYLAGQP